MWWLRMIGFRLTQVVIALVVSIIAIFMVQGVQKFSTPSWSSDVSRSRGMLIAVGEVTSVDPAPEHKIDVKDVWIEKVMERYEAIPITRRQAGALLCVELSKADPEDLDVLRIARCDDPDKFLEGNGMRSSKDRRMIFIDAAAVDWPQSTQTFCIVNQSGEVRGGFEIRFP